jgi:hypothetical protein
VPWQRRFCHGRSGRNSHIRIIQAFSDTDIFENELLAVPERALLLIGSLLSY